MFFGYTQCPDVCPTTLAELAEAMKQLGPDADRVQVLFVTVDPERDTPELLAQLRAGVRPALPRPVRRRRRDRAHGEGIQGHLPEAAGHDARQLHDGPLGRHVHLRSARAGCASTSGYGQGPDVFAHDLRGLLEVAGVGASRRRRG